MAPLRCPACLRRWRVGGPYACDCLDTQEPPANEPPVGVVDVAPPPRLPWLVAVLLVAGRGVGAVWWGVRGGLRRVGLWP
jgi:hypothetical protein